MKIIHQYLKFLADSDKYKFDTIKGYQNDLKVFIKFTEKRMEVKSENLKNIKEEISLINKLNEADIFAYLQYLKQDCSNSPAAINRKLSALKKFFRYLKSNRLIGNDIVYDIRSLSIDQNMADLPVMDECTKLIDSVRGTNAVRDKLILMLFTYGGLSVDEVIYIKKSDIEDNKLFIESNGEIRKIFKINEPLKSILSDYLSFTCNHASEWLFSADGINHISKRTIHQLMVKHMKAAGLYTKGMTSEKLRKSGAFYLIRQNELELSHLQKFMGHKTSAVTKSFIRKQGIVANKKI